MLISQPRDVCDKAGAFQWLHVPQAARLDMILFCSTRWSQGIAAASHVQLPLWCQTGLCLASNIRCCAAE